MGLEVFSQKADSKKMESFFFLFVGKRKGDKTAGPYRLSDSKRAEALSHGMGASCRQGLTLAVEEGPEARWQAVLQTTSSVQPETLIPSHMDKRMKERLLSIYF